jgi:hypothetical protein
MHYSLVFEVLIHLLVFAIRTEWSMNGCAGILGTGGLSWTGPFPPKLARSPPWPFCASPPPPLRHLHASHTPRPFQTRHVLYAQVASYLFIVSYEMNRFQTKSETRWLGFKLIIYYFKTKWANPNYVWEEEACSMRCFTHFHKQGPRFKRNDNTLERLELFLENYPQRYLYVCTLWRIR